MNAILQQQTVFHLTGRRPDVTLEPIDGLGLRPALLARYRNLSRLRYDFPVVLLEFRPGRPFARPLSDIVNEVAQNAAPAGPSGEALRKHLLRVERAIRRAVAAGATGNFLALWQEAVEGLDDVDEKPREVLSRAGETAGVDGAVVDCDEALPENFLTHAWRAVQREKLGRMRGDINRLIARLSDILRADFVRSEEGRRPDTLKASLGTHQQGLFNFDVMARMLSLGGPSSRLSDARRGRIEGALAVLRAQRFFPAPAPGDTEAYRFHFDSCRAVQQAFTARLAAMVELVKAMSIAELEADGRYDEARHDAFFAEFDGGAVSAADLAMFPDYLVCLRQRPTGAATDVNLMELMSSGIPVKVLVETDDILEESSIGQGRFAFGVRSMQLASLAVGLTDAFVLQSTSSHLPRLAERILRGLAGPAPALFSVYTATPDHSGDTPRYLLSAAAMQSRAFPAFSYDPSAGPDMASRFSLEDNPQPERDWPVAPFEYADADLQRVTTELAFTLADFVMIDPRHARHFARVPREAWNEHMVPAAEWLSRPPVDHEHRVPYLLAVDAHDMLQRLVVDDRLMQAARRCAENWHRLQEMGGVNNSHAARLLARERAAWEAQQQAAPPPSPEPQAQAQSQAQAQPAEERSQADEEPERSPDEAWIETIRCSTCNECTQINDKMFAYNENQQAYIKDLKAGTFRELVEAAESCQLSIIHPGKPVNPKEPGLEELVARAQLFQ
jgi:hypothetical protein